MGNKPARPLSDAEFRAQVKRRLFKEQGEREQFICRSVYPEPGSLLPETPVVLARLEPKPVSYYVALFHARLEAKRYGCSTKFVPGEPQCRGYFGNFFEAFEAADPAWYREFRTALLPYTILEVGRLANALIIELTGDLIPAKWEEEARIGRLQLAEEERQFRAVLEKAMSCYDQGSLQFPQFKYAQFLYDKYMNVLHDMGLRGGWCSSSRGGLRFTFGRLERKVTPAPAAAPSS